MGDVVDVSVFDCSGHELWRGAEDGLPDFLATVAGANTAVGAMAGLESVPVCSRNDVMRAAEDLQFITRRGMPKGFLTTLPEGKQFDACITAFNAPHLESLNVTPIDFPLVFDSAGAAMTDLIEPYHLQGRTFALANQENLRLSYAADPNLFSWLQGRGLVREQLPYAMYSPQPVFRNFRSGELSIQRTRQFMVPDIHILASREDATEEYLRALELGAESTRFWFGDDYVHVLDSVVGSTNDNPEFYARAGKAAGGITVVKRLAERPKYYAQKTGILIWSGYDNVMLHNLQMDEVNAVRFDFRIEDGEYPFVIHACVAMGLSRMLPLVLGRGVAEITPKTLPVELSGTQVTVLPISEAHAVRARIIANELRDAGVRSALDTTYGKSIGARLAKLRKAWQAKYVVVGDRELSERPLIQDSTRSVAATTIEEFVRVHGDRIRRCTPAQPARIHRLPFRPGT